MNQNTEEGNKVVQKFDIRNISATLKHMTLTACNQESSEIEPRTGLIGGRLSLEMEFFL